MNKTNNHIFSKPFVRSLFIIQNEWHQHGVLVHSLRVFWNVLKNGEFKFLAAALLHDIGKPFVAYQKPKDIEHNQYSFTDHEERSYQIIKNWPFVSRYTKELVRYHYLIRDISKHKTKEPSRSQAKERIWKKLSSSMQNDLKRFMIYDDLAKGKKRR